MNNSRLIIVCSLLIIYAINSHSQDDVRNISINNSDVSGTYSIWFSESNDEKKILKPFIVSEGFDATDKNNAEFVYTERVNHYRNFLDNLRKRNFDIIILDLKNNTSSIPKNADLFIELVKSINKELITNKSDYRINALGVSMSGLIVRYALAKMEKLEIDHRVENYISFDSPQMGANIPLGIQHMIDTYLGSLITVAEWTAVLNNLDMNQYNAEIAAISNSLWGCDLAEFNADILTAADYSAAFEMSMVYMHNNKWRKGYLEKLNSVNNFPVNCRSIAISMGANGNGQGFNAGAPLLNYNNNLTLINYSLPLPFGLGSKSFKWTPLKLSNTVNTMPGDGAGRTYNSTIEIQPYINLPTVVKRNAKYYYEHGNLVAPTNCNIDNVPGAYLDFPIENLSNWLNKEIITIPIDISKRICVWHPLAGHICKTVGKKFDISFKPSDILGTLSNSTNYKFCFVPTLSALGINSSDWYADIRDIIPTYPYPNNKSITPFDAIQYSKYNNLHARMPEKEDDSSVYNFLEDELFPENLFIQNKEFTDSYSNVFEATTITIGRNIDPVPNRSSIGDVTSNTDSKITFRVPLDGTITLKPGCHLKGNINLFVDENYTRPTLLEASSTTTVATPQNAELKTTTPSTPIITNSNSYSAITITDDHSDSYKSSLATTNLDFNIPETKISIYPNPVINIGNIYIEISKQTKLKVSIISMQGMMVKSIIDNTFQTGIYTVSFNTLELAKGLYFCDILYDNKHKTIKLIIK